MKSIAVFCGASMSNDPIINKQAHDFGKLLAEQKRQLIYGGAKIGVMGELASGVLENGGKAIGVIPDFLTSKEVVHTDLSELIITKTMHDRKLKMHELSDGFIALPGGFGTFEELFEIITWAQLGLHQKPIGLLNSNGFYNDLVNMLEKMVSKGFLKLPNLELLIIDDNVDSLLRKMKDFEPVDVPKWLKANRT